MLITDYLDHWARQQPDTTYADDGERSITYAEAQRWSNQIGQRLHAELQPGDRVGILAKNSLEILVFYFGAFRAGVVPVPLNFRLAVPEWKYIAEDAGVRMVVAEADLAVAFEPVRAALDVPGLVTGPAGPGPDGWGDFDAEVALQPTTPPDVEVVPTDDLYQMYTSGTTGRPKGAVLTHRAIAENISQIILDAGFHRTRAMIVMPLFHAGAVMTAIAQTAAGSTMTILRDFDPPTVLQRLREDRIVVATFVPAMVQMLLATPGVRDAPFPDLELVIYGASPIISEVLRDAMGVFGCDFLQAFGMTETSALATFLYPADHRRALEGRPELLLSAGRPVMGTQLRICDADGRELPVGEVGEILIRGPQLMRGYWNLPEATSAALVDGWMHTGDAGRFDEDGYLYISDRIKDMVVSGGENVYPREVEEALFQLDGIADAAVIGVPDERWGEAVKAIVVTKPDTDLDEASVIAHCRDHLAGYKCPKSVDFVTELPRNATGKVLKTELRAPYWEGQQRSVN